MAKFESYLARQPWMLAPVGGMVFLLAAFLSELLPHQQGLTALWLPNAMLLAGLVHAPRPDQRLPLVVGALAGGFVSLIARGMPPITWLAFPIANVLESTIGAMLIWRMGGLRSTFERFDDVVRMVVAALVAPILPAMIAMVALNLSFGAGWFASFYAWYGAAAISLLLITPATLAALSLCEDPVARRRIALKAVDLGGLIAAIAGVTTLVFFVVRFPSIIVLMPVMMFAAFRQRQLGAIAGVLTMALVAIEATLHGYGPIARAAVDNPQFGMVVLQLDLGAAFLVALPVASALTERDARAAEAQVLADQFRAVVENVGEVIFRTDAGGRWTYLNPAWLAVSGHDTAHSLGISWLWNIDPRDHAELEQWALPVLTGEVESSRRLIRFQTAHRGWRWMEMTMQTLFNGDGQVLGATGTLRDIDDRKRLEEHVLSAKRQAEQRAAEAVMLAATDELTGLANRRAFLRHLTRQIEAAGDLGQTFALAIFDVDHFKTVNDAYGHAVGDRVLQRVAARAMGVVRSGDLVGRIGGEEFGILMPGASPEDAALVAERLCRTIESPEMPLEDALPTVTVSVGVAALTGAGDGAELMARADAALYVAKAEGRNQIRLAA